LHEGRNRNLGNRLVIRRETHATARIAATSPLPRRRSPFPFIIRYFSHPGAALPRYVAMHVSYNKLVTRAIEENTLLLPSIRVPSRCHLSRDVEIDTRVVVMTVSTRLIRFREETRKENRCGRLNDLVGLENPRLAFYSRRISMPVTSHLACS